MCSPFFGLNALERAFSLVIRSRKTECSAEDLFHFFCFGLRPFQGIAGFIYGGLAAGCPGFNTSKEIKKLFLQVIDQQRCSTCIKMEFKLQLCRHLAKLLSAFVATHADCAVLEIAAVTARRVLGYKFLTRSFYCAKSLSFAICEVKLDSGTDHGFEPQNIDDKVSIPRGQAAVRRQLCQQGVIDVTGYQGVGKSAIRVVAVELLFEQLQRRYAHSVMILRDGDHSPCPASADLEAPAKRSSTALTL